MKIRTVMAAQGTVRCRAVVSEAHAMLRVVRPLLGLPLALALVACGPIDGTTTAAPRSLEPGGRIDATVIRVVDGDTVHAQIDGVDTTIRLIGVDTPETVAPGQPIECYGPQASRFTTAQLDGQDVELEFDQDLIDPYERTLAYVWLDGKLFNETLVARGFAEAKDYPPNTKYQERLDAAETRASADGRGLWGACEGLLRGTIASLSSMNPRSKRSASPRSRPAGRGRPSAARAGRSWSRRSLEHFDRALVDEVFVGLLQDGETDVAREGLQPLAGHVTPLARSRALLPRRRP
jgi:micrococcal nuclease